MDEYLSAIADATEPLPDDVRQWLAEGVALYRECGGALSLDRCLGVETEEPKRSRTARRNQFLRRAFAEFQPRRERANTDIYRQFAEIVKRYARQHGRFVDNGRMPRDDLRRFLYLAFDQGAAIVKSDDQLRRILRS